MVKPFPFAVAAAFLTVAGAVVEIVTLDRADPAIPRCGYLLLLLSMPLWIVAEIRRARSLAEDAFSAGYYKAARQFEMAAGSPVVTAVEETERHGR